MAYVYMKHIFYSFKTLQNAKYTFNNLICKWIDYNKYTQQEYHEYKIVKSLISFYLSTITVVESLAM